MASKAVSLWTSCLKDLEQVVSGPIGDSADSTVTYRIKRCCEKLEVLPEYPRAVCKKLVNELKVRIDPVILRFTRLSVCALLTAVLLFIVLCCYSSMLQEHQVT